MHGLQVHRPGHGTLRTGCWNIRGHGPGCYSKGGPYRPLSWRDPEVGLGPRPSGWAFVVPQRCETPTAFEALGVSIGLHVWSGQSGQAVPQKFNMKTKWHPVSRNSTTSTLDSLDTIPGSLRVSSQPRKDTPQHHNYWMCFNIKNTLMNFIDDDPNKSRMLNAHTSGWSRFSSTAMYWDTWQCRRKWHSGESHASISFCGFFLNVSLVSLTPFKFFLSSFKFFLTKGPLGGFLG